MATKKRRNSILNESTLEDASDPDYQPLKMSRRRREKRKQQSLAASFSDTDVLSETGSLGQFSLLLSLLVHVNGLAFGGRFLGRFLSFRDALSVSRTCRLGHAALMHSSTFLPNYIGTTLQKFAHYSVQQPQITPDYLAQAHLAPFLIKPEVVSEFNRLLQLPVMKDTSFLYYRTLCQNTLRRRGRRNRAQMMDHLLNLQQSFVPEAGNEAGEHEEDDTPLPLWEITLAVDHLHLAWKHFGGYQASGDLTELEDWLSRASCPPTRLKDPLEKLPRKTRSPPWTHTFSSILVSWALGRGAAGFPLAQWESGAWMHQVLRFLVHSVDLDQSIWRDYLVDPRYLGFYKVSHFGSQNQNPDFWMLVNQMYVHNLPVDIDPLKKEAGEGSPVVFPVLGTPSYNSQETSALGMCDPGETPDAQTFQAMYRHHLHLAKSLVHWDPPCPTTLTKLGLDVLTFGQLMKSPVITLPSGAEAYIDFYTPPHYVGDDVKISLIIHHGPIPQPTLIACLESAGDWKVFPSARAWDEWWPYILEKYHAL